MIVLLHILIITFISTPQLFSQDNYFEKRVNDITKIKKMPYVPEYSGDTLYWNLVKEGIIIVPYLIEKLDNAKPTNIYVELTGGNYTIADIANLIIWDIIRDLPVFEFTGSNKILADSCGICYYWNYIRASQANRTKYKSDVYLWFNKNKNNFEWFVDNLEFMGGTHKFPRKHPAGGYFVLNKK